MRSSPIRILLIDDDEDDYLIMKELLFEAIKPKPEVEWVSHFDSARDAIGRANHDVYLIDYRLGEKNGLELLKSFDLSQRHEPFVILTGAGDESVERQAMEIGVADYLVKGKFEAELLRRVIEYSLQRKHLEVQRIRHLLELNRSKDEFIAVASHQLRTPATAVKQYLGVLMGGYAGDMSQEQTIIIKRAYTTNERQIKIVDDILRIAQLDLDKVELHKEMVDVRPLVEHCSQDLKLTAKNRDQTITLQLPDRPIQVLCDPTFTAMAIGNLLENASKYSDHNTTIQVSVAQVSHKVEIAITDEGVGIDKQEQKKLFKKFSRIDNPLSLEVGGTGLGLYWAKAIITMHHGDITVISKKGVGSTFTVTLPVAGTVQRAKHREHK